MSKIQSVQSVCLLIGLAHDAAAGLGPEVVTDSEGAGL